GLPILASRCGERSAALGDRRLGLGQVDLLRERLAAGLGDEAGGLAGGQVADAGLVGRVGRHGQAFKALDRGGIRLGGQAPGVGGVGVLAKGGVGVGRDDRVVVGRVLDQL